VDEPLGFEESGGAGYYHADGLGSIVKATDSAGAVTLVRQYDAWGKLQTGVEQAGYAFTGREWDPETGLKYYRARYYEPNSGRFLSEDPLGQVVDVNLYSYVRNQPSQLIDPSGKAWCLPLVGEGPSVPVFGYYARKSFTEIPNKDGATRDRERHCWAACMTKRVLSCNVIPEITIILSEGFGGVPANGPEDSAKDAGAHYWGVWVWITQRDCKEACMRCPLNEDYR
jgi:RHS repeat-associated protein